MPKTYLACDLGAESGRVIAGQVLQGRLHLEELHRFANTPIRTSEGLFWNFPDILAEIQKGLTLAAVRDLDIGGISTDSWGVDYVLLDEIGQFMAPVYHYRDERSSRGVAQIYRYLTPSKIFAETGIQFMPINTLYQLGAESPARFAQAHAILGIADAVNYWMSGVVRAEESLASTFQFFNPQTRQWSKRLWQALAWPENILPKVVPPGTVIGSLTPSIARATGLRQIPILATCSHDTGAAVVAVPATGSNWAYLSSGTWSLIGVERQAPVLTERCRELNFTNELGYGGTVRLLKNIVGLWMVQECRRAWAQEGDQLDYTQLARLAGEAEPFLAIINPADPRFIEPGAMPQKVTTLCIETGQRTPSTPGETIRIILESLALLYARTLAQLEELTDQPIETLHIVGGGSRNHLLNQFAANATRRHVFAGPAEGTAAGNILVQAITLGEITDVVEARQLMRRSTELVHFVPENAYLWQEATQRFNQLFPQNQSVIGGVKS